jgi:hypothetical protein
MKRRSIESSGIARRPRERRSLRRLLLLLLAFAPACGETVTGPPLAATAGPTATLAPTRTPTPTPAPSVDVTGSWRGTFTGVSISGCSTRVTIPATAKFRQIGSAVEGSISAGCGLRNQYSGTIQGQSLVLSAGSLTIRGTATASHVNARVAYVFGLVNGTLSLDRVSP